MRDAGVSSEDRAVLMGHAVKNMSEHYATPTIARLIEMSNKVMETLDSMTVLKIVMEKSRAESRAKEKGLTGLRPVSP
jgi:hypothetical protein